jgi:hypothetical protein
MLQIVGYYEGRGQVLAYAKGPSHAEFVASVFLAYLGDGWTVVAEPEGQEVINVFAA